MPTYVFLTKASEARGIKEGYLNLQDTNRFVVIDPATDSVAGTYTVGDCQGNHGMTLDTAGRRAFLACEGNDRLEVMELNRFEPIASVPIAPGEDVIKFDPELKRIYAACYSGAISVVHQDSSDQYTKLEDFPVEPKVHTLTVDLRTHRLYAPEQEEGSKVVSRMTVYEATQEAE